MRLSEVIEVLRVDDVVDSLSEGIMSPNDLLQLQTYNQT